MSNGLTFDKRMQNAKSHARVLQQVFSDGIINGCNVSYTNTTVTVHPGHFVISGRLVEITEAETVTLISPISVGYVRLKYVVDLTQTASKDIFTQGHWVYDYAAVLGGFSPLTQEDINAPGATNNTYEIEFAVYGMASSVISVYIRSIGAALRLLQLTGGTLAGALNSYNLISTTGTGSLFADFGVGTGSNFGRLAMVDTGVFTIQSDGSVRVVSIGNTAFIPIAASAFNVGSSYRYKNNIKPFADAEVRKLLKIELKTFAYKPEYSDDGETTHMGVIAEDLIDLFPDAVTVDKEGLPSGVDYAKLVMPCIGMIQQQEAWGATLESENTALKALLVSKGILNQAEIDNL